MPSPRSLVPVPSCSRKIIRVQLSVLIGARGGEACASVSLEMRQRIAAAHVVVTRSCIAMTSQIADLRDVGRRASEMLPPFEMFDLSIVTMKSERNSSFGIHGTDRSPRVVNDKLFYIAAEDRPGLVRVIRFRSERRID